MEPILATRHLCKSFGSFDAVSDVSLEFAPGQIHAVLGENGAGKSTLMKLLFGLHDLTSGEIFLRGESVKWSSSMDAIKCGLGMVQQHFMLVDVLSAIDNIMLGAELCDGLGRLRRADAIKRLQALLPSESLSVPWNTKVEDLTVGQKQRLEILKLLFRKSEILFLDEPTAVLTPQEIEDLFKLLRELKASGRTIVLITHKINEVMQLCDTYAVLRQGRLVVQNKVAGVSAERIVEQMIGRKLSNQAIDRVASGVQTVFECENLLEGEGVHDRLAGLSMSVRAGEVVGVAGVDGSGQSHLVEALMGLREVSGEIHVLGKKILATQTAIVRDLGVGLVPEDRHLQGLWMDESCFTNMIVGLEDRFLRHHLFQNALVRSETSGWAKDFDVRASSLENPVAGLSGGNQQKVIFAREVSGRKPKFLVCHQPTRGVDLGAIELIHEKILALRNAGVGVLVLSSELDELLHLCDRIFVLFEGRVSAEFARADFDRLKIGAAMTGASYAQ